MKGLYASASVRAAEEAAPPPLRSNGAGGRHRDSCERTGGTCMSAPVHCVLSRIRGIRTGSGGSPREKTATDGCVLSGGLSRSGISRWDARPVAGTSGGDSLRMSFMVPATGIAVRRERTAIKRYGKAPGIQPVRFRSAGVFSRLGKYRPWGVREPRKEVQPSGVPPSHRLAGAGRSPRGVL